MKRPYCLNEEFNQNAEKEASNLLRIFKEYDDPKTKIKEELVCFFR